MLTDNERDQRINDFLNRKFKAHNMMGDEFSI